MMPPELPAMPAPWPCQLVQSPPSEGRGRYVVSTESVPPGRLLLEDSPYHNAAVVADSHRGYCCAYCITLCSTRILQCGGCKQAHYCSEDCVRRDAEAVHARGECQALVGLAKMGVEGDSQPMRLALRIATLNNDQPRQRRDHDDDAAANPFHTPAFVAGLDHHFDATPAAVRQGVLAVAQALAGLLRPAGVRTTASALARILLAIQCNAHGIRNGDGHVLGLGLFPLASMLNHSCKPTAYHAFRLVPGRPPTLVFRSLRALGRGQELCYSYTDLLHPASLRRAQLSVAYYFECGCARCAAYWEPEVEDGGSSTDRLIERALASPACAAGEGHCPGVLMPVGTTAGDNDGLGEEDDDSQPLLRCSSCGGKEPAAAAEARVAVGTALLEARLRELALHDDGDDAEEEGEQAVRALASMLLGDGGEEDGEEEEDWALLPPVGLHPQHWLVTQALLAFCQRLAMNSGRKDDDRDNEADACWRWAAAEAWALQSLWVVGTAMTGPGVGSEAEEGDDDGLEAVGRFPELGQRLLAAARALRSLGSDEVALSLLGCRGDGAEGGAGERPAARGGLLARAQRSLAGPGVGLFTERLAPLRQMVVSEGIEGLERLGRSILSTG